MERGSGHDNAGVPDAMNIRNLRRQSAFTLIEILVVASIISLLIAILLPSLARSRENTRSVICRSNLKQWGNAMWMYVDANRGMLPYENRGQEADGHICWFDSVERYLGHHKDEGVKICPTVRRFQAAHEESYRINSKLADPFETKPDGSENPYYMPYRKLSTLDRPKETVLLFDGDVDAKVLSFKGRWRTNDREGDDVSYRHNVATNLLFTDWHVENIRKKALHEKSIRNEPIVWQPADMGPWDPTPHPRP